MLKNIALGVVLTSISAGLVYGAVIRTDSRAAAGVEANEGNAVRSGRNQVVSETDNSLNSGSGNGGNGRQGGNSSTNSNSGKQTSGDQLKMSSADVDETYVFEGAVQDVNEDYLVIETLEGSQIVVENRAWWYATDAGFSASAGDEVSMVGFYDEDGVLEVISLQNLTEGISVSVREDNGRPLWAGLGRGSGQK